VKKLTLGTFAVLAAALAAGTVTTATVRSNITNSRVCQSRPFPLPMDCGPWKY
jgi:hypothetical protein